jgi:hypothetical protein
MDSNEQLDQQIDDIVEQEARFYNTKAPGFSFELRSMSKGEMERLLRNLILFPLEQDDLKHSSPKEVEMFNLTMSLYNAKMVIMSYSQSRSKEKANGKQDG